MLFLRQNECRILPNAKAGVFRQMILLPECLQNIAVRVFNGPRTTTLVKGIIIKILFIFQIACRFRIIII